MALKLGTKEWGEVKASKSKEQHGGSVSGRRDGKKVGEGVYCEPGGRG